MLSFRALLLGAIAIATVAVTTKLSVAELEDEEFSSEPWRITMSVPTNWQPTEQTAYPNILLWMERREPRGVMLLGAEPVAKGTTSLQYAKKTVPLLEKMGFATRSPQLHTTTGASILDFESEKAFLRQAFLVVGDFGYTLTLSAESSRTRGFHLRAFDDALREIKPLRTEPKTEAKQPTATNEKTSSDGSDKDKPNKDRASEESPARQDQ